ncbi:MAG: hypothetical protein IJO27_05395 [Bacilli bacterium]|nr:hypothetical protein [Bacilli bacterium]
MNKKPGFQVKVGGETIVFILIGVCIAAFVFFMPNIYMFFSGLKNNTSNKNNEPIVNSPVQNEQKEENKVQEPIGEITLACTKTISEPEGNLVENYTFYYNNGVLETIKNEKNYDAISDEYLNYIYSEQANFDNMNNLYKNLDGFSYESKNESRTLVVTFSYDLTKLDPNNLVNANEKLNIELKVTKNNSSESVKQIYEDLGYKCR